MSYVDKDKLMSHIEYELMKWGETEYNALQILGDIEDFPADDVTEVVRCRNCIRFVPSGNGKIGRCTHPKCAGIRWAKEFCSNGERSDI